LELRRGYEKKLIEFWRAEKGEGINETPDWISHLVLSADQFIINRPLIDEPDGKSIIAGYHWFADWDRDTMISLPGLTIATGRSDVARSIIRTYARYVN
jgi:predicted glycogen debranching enzyme